MHLLIKICGTNIPCCCFDRVLVLFGIPASFPRIGNNQLHRHFDLRSGVLFVSECTVFPYYKRYMLKGCNIGTAYFVTLFEYLINK